MSNSSTSSPKTGNLFWDSHGIGIYGIQALRGPAGVAGTAKRIEKLVYTLVYCGLDFIVEIKPSTFQIFNDPTEVNGDELAFLKVIDPDEWYSIRSAWSRVWINQRAYEAFESGELKDD